MGVEAVEEEGVEEVVTLELAGLETCRPHLRRHMRPELIHRPKGLRQ